MKGAAPKSESKPTGEHVAETVRSIAELRADHHRRSTPLQRLADKLTRFFGQPSAEERQTGKERHSD